MACSLYTRLCFRNSQLCSILLSPCAEISGAVFHRSNLPQLRTASDVSPSAPENVSQVREQKCALPPWQLPKGRNTGIQVRNFLTRKLEPLIAPTDRPLSWYMCGPTVYDDTHIGHALCYVKFDIIRRILHNFFNVQTHQVINITDVDDKIIQRARQRRLSVADLARHYEDMFLAAMASLQVLPADKYLRVTEHIPEIVAFIQRLIANGYAYQSVTGDINFDSLKFREDFHCGKLLPEAHKVKVFTSSESKKRCSSDFALWKTVHDPNELCWTISFDGMREVAGRPGWHIECSTLASLSFGKTIDLHTGGLDLRFPHHECEIAQCEAGHGVNQWASYFLYTGQLRVDGCKMSKSLNNFITVSDFLEEYSADVFRLMCLTSHYSHGLEYSESVIETVNGMHNKLQTFFSSAKAYIEGQVAAAAVNEPLILQSIASTQKDVASALADDFDTAAAVQKILKFASLVSTEIHKSEKVLSGTPRSPAVVGAAAGFVHDMLYSFGLNMRFHQSEKSNVEQPVSEVTTEFAIDQCIRLRRQVRNLAFGRTERLAGVHDLIVESLTAKGQSAPSDKEVAKFYRSVLSPLMAMSDDVRDNFRRHGLLIKDHGMESSWEWEKSTRDLSNPSMGDKK